MSRMSLRADAISKFGPISAMWEMGDEARRIAVRKRAARGAAKTLHPTRRDVLVIEPTPEPSPTPIVLQLTVPVGAPAWKRILFETAIKHAVTPADILSQIRPRPVVAARQEVMWRMRKETSMSLTAIGLKLNRDHSTTLHGIRTHAAKIASGEVQP